MSHELTKYFSGPQVLNGKPGYINLLDALNSWALVKEVLPNPWKSFLCARYPCSFL